MKIFMAMLLPVQQSDMEACMEFIHIVWGALKVEKDQCRCWVMSFWPAEMRTGKLVQHCVTEITQRGDLPSLGTLQEDQP